VEENGGYKEENGRWRERASQVLRKIPKTVE
jgi:hypothetical protein